MIVSQPGVQAADFADKTATPHLRMMMRGDEQSIRSSLTVEDVYGAIDTELISKTVEEKCNAGQMRIEASSATPFPQGPQSRSAVNRLTDFLTAGSFALGEESRPQVIHVDFLAPPKGKDRALKLAENGTPLSRIRKPKWRP